MSNQSRLKLRPNTLQQIRAECDYAFIYHRDAAGRPAVTHCILYRRSDSIYCRGFAILSPLDIKLGRVRKRRGEMVALGRAWKALQIQSSFGSVGRFEVEDLLTDLADPCEGDPANPVLAELAINSDNFHKAQYDITPLYEEHEVLNARRYKKVLANLGADPSISDWVGTDPATGTPHLQRSRYQMRPVEEINRTLRALGAA